MGMRQLLSILAAAGAVAALVFLSLPDTVEYEFGEPRALSGDLERGEWVDGWYWSLRTATGYATRRLAPGASARCAPRGRPVQSFVGTNRLFRRWRCTVRFTSAPGRNFAAALVVQNRDGAAVACGGCPAQPAQRRGLLRLADRFVRLTNRAIPYHERHARPAPAHLAQAERLRDALAAWSRRNPLDDASRPLARTGEECAGALLDLLRAPQQDAARTNAYNDCIDRFGAAYETASKRFA